MQIPDKDEKFPLAHYDRLCFLKNIITNPNIEVGDYTYYDDFEDVAFCMIASGVIFIMNGANHKMDGITAYPFNIFGKDWKRVEPELSDLPFKGDTIIGNDVWIGSKATIMPGVKVGDGAIIATNATVVKDVAPYTIVGGNPATEIKKRFSTEKIAELMALKWWDWGIEKITENLEFLTRKTSTLR